jgi:simple sugar transport system substrate-binding protein
VQLALYRRFGLMPSSLDAGAAIVDRQNVELVRQLSKQSIR